MQGKSSTFAPMINHMEFEEPEVTVIGAGLTGLTTAYWLKKVFINISRHRRAIPQYTATSGQRFEAVESIQKQFSGLLIGGNLRDGIGMGHRITQATNIANHIFNTIKK